VGRREELVKGRLGKVMGAEWRPPRRGGSHSDSGSVSCNQGEWKLDHGSGAEWLPVETTLTRDRCSLMKAEGECVMQCPEGVS
jgi:hypothetical protein